MQLGAPVVVNFIKKVLLIIKCVGYLVVANAPADDVAMPGNMFVPIDILKPVLGDLLARGRSSAPTRPWLGLYSQEIQGRLFVARVPEGGPADAAGMRPGDLVLQFDRRFFQNGVVRFACARRWLSCAHNKLSCSSSGLRSNVRNCS